MTDRVRTVEIPAGSVEARHYDRLSGGEVRCRLCPVGCRLDEDAVGVCRTRRNVGGRLYYLYYGACSSLALDPIEKKPLYHFHPGSTILSLGSLGCNLSCSFCQNWEIAQSTVETQEITPETLAGLAAERRREGCVGIAYTYNEPLVGYEFVFDTARLVHERGLANVLVTNGEILEEPFRELLPFIDALNIDVKSFTEEFYRTMCKGRLAPVLRTAKIAAENAHVELTNLIIPTKNDAPEEISALVDWVAENLGEETPMHFSRYYPRHKETIPATPVETLERVYDIARRRLKYVYVGNAWEIDGADTICPACGEKVIIRRGYAVKVKLSFGSCPVCGTRIAVHHDDNGNS